MSATRYQLKKIACVSLLKSWPAAPKEPGGLMVPPGRRAACQGSEDDAKKRRYGLSGVCTSPPPQRPDGAAATSAALAPDPSSHLGVPTGSTDPALWQQQVLHSSFHGVSGSDTAPSPTTAIAIAAAAAARQAPPVQLMGPPSARRHSNQSDFRCTSTLGIARRCLPHSAPCAPAARARATPL